MSYLTDLGGRFFRNEEEVVQFQICLLKPHSNLIECWITTDTDGNWSTSENEGDAHIFPAADEKFLEKLIGFLQANFPGHGFSVIKARVH